MNPISLPTIFERLAAGEDHELVEQAIAAGRRTLGYTCSFVPEPLLSVDGLVPLRLRALEVVGTPMADTYLSSVLCPYVRSLCEAALDGSWNHLAGWVFAVSCDHLRRLVDNLCYLVKPAFVHVVDVPHKADPPAVSFYADELGRLASHLASFFDVDVGPQALGRAIERHNEHLALLRSISELRKREHPPLSGRAFHALLVACATAPKDLLRQRLVELCETLPEAAGIREYRARLLVVGSHLDDPRVIGIVESQGGLVVGDRFCVGSLPGLEPIEANDDPLSALAAHYLGTTRCPRMMESFDVRLRDIIAAAARFRAHGIVVQTMKFCDLWGMEASPLCDALRAAGWPVLRVEREYALTGEGQLRTRIQAFIESMGK